MIKYILTTTAAIGMLTSEAYADGPVLTITDFIGTINIEEGSKITVSGEAKGTQSSDGDSVTIDGGETINSINCKGHYGSFKISLGKRTWMGNSGGYKDLDEYPSLEIKAPKDVHLIIKDSVVFGEGGDIGSADLDLRGCGELTVGDIAGPLDLNISGSTDLKSGNTGPAKVSISGSGDAILGNVVNLDVKVAGSGDLEVGDVSGPLIATVRGSGDFEAGNVSGDVVYEGTGSSDVEIEKANARLSIETRGSGDVMVRGGNVSDLLISASGSSDVEFEGTAANADLIASGSSNINVDEVTGETRVSRRASADIRVGSKVYDD